MRISINKYLIFFVVVGLAGLSAVHAQQADSLTLQAAIQSALENNRLIHIKELQVKESEAKIKEANIKKYPAVSLNSAYQYNVNTGSLIIPAGTMGTLPLGGSEVPLPGDDLEFELGKHNTFNAGVTVCQPLMQLRKINTGVKISKTENAIAALEHTKVELQITNAVEQLYYGILAIRKRMLEYQKNIEVAQLKLYDVQSALFAGKTVAANEAGLHAEMANEEQELLKLKFEEEDYIAELKKLTGITGNEIVLADVDAAVTFSPGLDEYQTEASSNNTDIRLTELQKERSGLAIKAARQSYLPDLGVVVGYTYQEGNSIMAKSLPYAGVNFKWNIQDVFSNRQVVSQRQFQQLQAEENNQYTKQQTTVSVEKAYRKLKQAEDLIAVAQKAVSYRKAQLKIESDKNEAGIGQAIDVLETEAELAKSEADLYGAMMSYKASYAELQLLTGKGN